MSEPMKALKQAGLNDEHVVEALALEAPMAAKGLNFLKIIALVSKYGPTVIAVLKELLANDQAEPTPSTIPPIPQR